MNVEMYSCNLGPSYNMTASHDSSISPLKEVNRESKKEQVSLHLCAHLWMFCVCKERG